MGKKKTKSKRRRVFKKQAPTFDSSKTRKEIEVLQAKKKEVQAEVEKSKEGKKGFAKFAAGLSGIGRQAGLNKSISDKRKILGTHAGLERIKTQTAVVKQQVELQKARGQLASLRKKNQVDFNSGGIKYEDLFK